MQYVCCRSCLLRLGQPWQIIPIRNRSSPRLLPQISRRAAVHGVASSVKGGSHVAFEEQFQNGGAPASMTDDAALRTASLDSAKQLRDDEFPSPLDISDHPPEDDRITVRPMPVHRPPKPPFPLPTITTSTLTQSDARIQFVRDIKNVEDGAVKMASVIHRFDDWEQFQRERLAKVAPGHRQRLAFTEFTAWKRLVKDFRIATLESAEPTSEVEMTQAQWLRDCDTVEEMLASIPRFQGKNRSKRRRADSQLMSVALRFVPEKIRLLLECIMRTHKPPSTPEFYVVEDVLEMLAMRVSVVDPSERPAYAADLALLVANVLRNSRRHFIQLTQATIVHILGALPEASIEPWYQQLCAVHCALHPNTELQFASRLAKSPSTKSLSTQVLLSLRRAGVLDINNPIAASVCTSILTFRKEDLAALDSLSATPADLFSTLHSIGLTPNVITYSAIMRGLCLKGDLRTALDVFEVMKQHGVQPDAVAFSILIHGCKICRDFDTLAELTIQAYLANIRDPVVWNDVLHALYICCLEERKDRRGPRRTVLFALNSVYTRIFNPEPVRPFITKRLIEMSDFATLQSWFPEAMKRITAEIPPLRSQELVQPGSDTLAIMILGLVRYLPMPYDVVMFYLQFRQMLAEGHPLAELMVRERGTFVHDIILRNLVKWRGTMRIALDIIRDMMRDVGQGSGPQAVPSGPMPTPRRTAGGEATREAGTVAGAEGPEMVTTDSSPDGEAHHGAANIQGTAAMLEDSGHPLSEGVQTPENGAPGQQRPPIRHPSPSVYTWSILMHGFMRHKQPREAERIISLMREHGVEPNIVTWNTLAAGYAKMQKIPQAVEAMRRLEAEGFKADDSTLRAFSYIANKEKAIKLMEATVEANKVKKMTSELLLQKQQQQQQHEGEEREEEVEKTGEQAPAQTQRDQAYAHAEAEQGQGSEDEEEALSQDLEARLLQLDPGAVPDDVSNKILRVVQEMQTIAPVSQRPELVEWARIRRGGLEAASNSTTPHDTERRNPLGRFKSSGT